MRFEEIKQQALAEWNDLMLSDQPKILVGAATCGRSAGALQTIGAFRKELAQRNVDAKIVEVGCMGPCFAEPVVNIIKPGRPGICFTNVLEDRAAELVEKYIANDDPVPQYALGKVGEGTIPGISDINESSLFKSQERRL